MTPIAVTITGSTSLLCGRPAPGPAPDGASPVAQAAQRLYLDDAGRPVIPGLNLFRCLAEAAHHHGRTPAEVVHALGIAERDLVIHTTRPWSVDARMVRHQQTGEWILCHRPRFAEWRLGFTLLVDPDLVPLRDAFLLLTTAGIRVGLGDYRPERGGPFGRFAVTTWEPMP